MGQVKEERMARQTTYTYINNTERTINVETQPIQPKATFIKEEKPSQEIKNLIANKYISEVEESGNESETTQ